MTSTRLLALAATALLGAGTAIGAAACGEGRGGVTVEGGSTSTAPSTTTSPSTTTTP